MVVPYTLDGAEETAHVVLQGLQQCTQVNIFDKLVFD